MCKLTKENKHFSGNFAKAKNTVTFKVEDAVRYLTSHKICSRGQELFSGPKYQSVSHLPAVELRKTTV